jgi:hypothetical protein
MTTTKPPSTRPVPVFILTRYQVRRPGTTEYLEAFRSGKEAIDFANSEINTHPQLEVFDNSQKKVIHTTEQVETPKAKTAAKPKNTDKAVDGKVTFTLIGDVCGYIRSEFIPNVGAYEQGSLSEQVNDIWLTAETKKIGIFKGKSQRETVTMNKDQLSHFAQLVGELPKNERKNVDFKSNPERNIYWGLKRAVDKVQNLLKTAF